MYTISYGTYIRINGVEKKNREEEERKMKRVGRKVGTIGYNYLTVYRKVHAHKTCECHIYICILVSRE